MNWKSVPQPMIDVVDGKNFNYEEQPGGILRGSFSWELLYKRLPITGKYKHFSKRVRYTWRGIFPFL